MILIEEIISYMRGILYDILKLFSCLISCFRKSAELIRWFIEGKFSGTSKAKNACEYSMNLKVYDPILNETKNRSEIEELTKGGTHQIKEAKYCQKLHLVNFYL